MYIYFPKDIQDMLNNNDFRYGRKWLTVEQPEEEKQTKKK